MRFIALSIFFTFLACSTAKSKSSDKKDDQENTTIKTHTDIIVVLKNPKNALDTKALIENSGLIWNDFIINTNALKVVDIKVPIEKKDFWIKRLNATNEFSKVVSKSDKLLKSIKEEATNTFVKISKTPCLGECAVYDATFLNDGTLLFNGIKNTLVSGPQKVNISDETMKKIKEKFNKTTFGTYLDSYANRRLMDSPSTFITFDDKQIEIKLWKNVPTELTAAYKVLENVLLKEKLID